MKEKITEEKKELEINDSNNFLHDHFNVLKANDQFLNIIEKYIIEYKNLFFLTSKNDAIKLRSMLLKYISEVAVLENSISNSNISNIFLFKQASKFYKHNSLKNDNYKN